METFVIRTFDNYVQAHIVMGLLRDRGIMAFLQDENSVTINPILTNAVGGIKLFVPKQEVSHARAILSEIDEDNPEIES